MIVYGGVESRVRQQLECKHDWHGPCLDAIGRYLKCVLCFCLDRDVATEEELNEAIGEQAGD